MVLYMIYIYLPRRYYGPDKHEIVKAEQWQVYPHLDRFGLFTKYFVVPFITSYDEQFLTHLRDQHDIDLITGQWTIWPLLTTKEQTYVQIPFSSAFEEQHPASKGLATEVRKAAPKRANLDLQGTQESGIS